MMLSQIAKNGAMSYSVCGQHQWSLILCLVIICILRAVLKMKIFTDDV